MDQEVFKFRAIIWTPRSFGSNRSRLEGQQMQGSRSDDPVTCAAYAKQHDLLALEGWHRFRSLAKKDKIHTGAIKQSKIRQVRRSQT